MSTISSTPTFLISMPGGIEWVFIILAVILLFGGRKIPELAKGIGKGIRDFKDAKDGIKGDIETGMKSEETKSV
jgi:sec-independent protein translocase protein TatA